ncbi:MAG TPA: transcription antitermination factor NusB [Verrucomicrobiales bacterium]|nr:transcription antitermination factor NusB [Verrucomicrobiales bacterium]
MTGARPICLRALQIGEQSGAHADDILDRLCLRHQPDPRERALALSLLFGILRQRRLLDALIAQLGPTKLDPSTRRVLRLGLYQILFTRIPPHAAVHETVSLAPARSRGLVNAVLRRAAAERETLLALLPGLPPALRWSLPDFLYDRWAARFSPAELEKLCRWNQLPAPVYLRRNPLHPGSAAAIEALPDQKPVPGRSGFFLVDSLPRSLLDQGICTVQDPAASVACLLLAPLPGQCVLDACAAPGGKTSHLAALMENRGFLTATDHSPARLAQLQANLARLRVACAQTQLADWSVPRPDFPAEFDSILLDAPCSNTGALRRRADLRWRLQPGVFAEMAVLQLQLLANTAAVLRPGGALVYSTCSLEPEENEEVIAAFLASHPNFLEEARQTVLPHIDGFDGAFAVRLRRR